VALVDTLAESRHPRFAHDVVDATVVHIGDEETRRVRSEIYGGNAWHVFDFSRSDLV
jgi:hypothetical protein